MNVIVTNAFHVLTVPLLAMWGCVLHTLHRSPDAPARPPVSAARARMQGLLQGDEALAITLHRRLPGSAERTRHRHGPPEQPPTRHSELHVLIHGRLLLEADRSCHVHPMLF